MVALGGWAEASWLGLMLLPCGFNVPWGAANWSPEGAEGDSCLCPQIDMLQAEVTALKTLVITSTPSSPNRELHPQLQSPSKAGFRKGHGRNKSTSSAMVSAASQNVAPEPGSWECKEVGQGHSLHRPRSSRLRLPTEFCGLTEQLFVPCSLNLC